MMTTRKRNLPSVDGHSAKMSVREETSPVKRSSPRKKSDGCLDKENHPLPQRSPRRAAGVNKLVEVKKAINSLDDYPCSSGSPFKHAMVTSSFYGAKKTVYLTPLERKAVKESLPSPPAAPSPPAQAKKPVKKNTKKAVKECGKSYTTFTKTIKLNCSSSAFRKADAKSPSTVVSKPAEPKKAITLAFSSLKPKPKIFVGAAFFSTGKKPTSMYKKSATKSSTKPAAVRSQGGKSGKLVTRQPNQTQKHPAETSTKPIEKEAALPRTRFEPTDWFDTMNDLPGTPLSSPKVVALNYEITKELNIVLLKTPTPPSQTSRDLFFSPQDDSLTEPLVDFGDESPSRVASTSPKECTAAVYPIFGSASKRSKNKKAPLSFSTSAGPAASLQATAAKERPRRRKEKQDDDQLVIDAGQKQFGAITCSSCGMVYSADNPEDSFQHDQFHQYLLDSIKYVGWKKERVLAEFWDGKILMVMPDDPKYAIKKAEDVRRIADNELGFQQVTLSRPSQAKTYLFINTERVIVGCLIAEPIRQAFRVLEQSEQYLDMTKDDFMDRHRVWCCSTIPEKALCGVSRIWVFNLARRHGIARRMLDTVRSTFVYGSHLTKEEIAFSDPTLDGKQFASAYCGTSAFLVYNFIA
ncbi:N-acetyltransferase ESCO2 isoform X1 [Entelurus aequoreus]|uniref:N-acetyltransferase ESCO2 isoform X1 n=1 Tax=Entelurus aequoreus TaxID=161455 RepID=UPI002B1DF605|nr:N-acetyltransferase ESCO2 isoform X1 [Entelurus aequoreus]